MAAPEPQTLDRRALNRALIARQLLMERSPLTAVEAVEHLVGLQAQAPDPPYIGLWTRLAGFTIEELAATVRARQVVRIVLMRGTIHLVSAQDCLRLRPVLRESLERSLISTFGRKLAGADLDAVSALGRKLVEHEPLTLGALGSALAGRWPGHDAFALANAVRNRVPLIQVPPRGLWGESGQARHTTAESWLGAAAEPAADPAALVERYLAAFGPATVKDMQTWSGMTRLAAVVRQLGSRLQVFRDEQGQQLYDLPGAPRPPGDTPVPVRFLPEFDNILLSHADRSRILTEEQRRLVFTRNGIIRSTFLVDGFVHGLWRIERERDAARLVVRPWSPLGRGARTELTAEGARLLSFAAAGCTRTEVAIEAVG
ncbi:winged helix DNA-binding domain-containing protein [Streptomyces sp. NPDC056512]|uniref:winged helix DNA-binding domain-containing protein n=1 Tax=Streptomyces sp. NPDC056512 TaxID=3345846 RepID=UPI0036C38313